MYLKGRSNLFVLVTTKDSCIKNNQLSANAAQPCHGLCSVLLCALLGARFPIANVFPLGCVLKMEKILL